MSIFSSIFSGVSAIFGGSKDGGSKVMEVAKGVGGWVDNLSYTDEEKAKSTAEMVGIYADYLRTTIDENTERSKTRRDIAIWIIRCELIMLFMSIGMYKIDADYSEYIFKVATNDPMNYLVLGVGAFFFSAHLIRAAKV